MGPLARAVAVEPSHNNPRAMRSPERVASVVRRVRLFMVPPVRCVEGIIPRRMVEAPGKFSNMPYGYGGSRFALIRKLT